MKPKSSKARLIAFGFLGLSALGMTSWWMLALRAKEAEPSNESSLVLRHEGDRLVIPEKSPLRGSLQVQPVSEQTVAAPLVLPAVVEADPAKLVKVLPRDRGAHRQPRQAPGRCSQGRRRAVHYRLSRPRPGLEQRREGGVGAGAGAAERRAAAPAWRIQHRGDARYRASAERLCASDERVRESQGAPGATRHCRCSAQPGARASWSDPRSPAG